MPNYMTQTMRSGTLQAITYYRRARIQHPSHEESRQFTNDARTNYANTNHINFNDVERGTYRSAQGVPGGGNTQEI